MGVGIGVVGCGQWGMNHIRNFVSLPDATVVRCCDVSDQRLETVQRLYRGIEVTTALEEVVGDANIDAVVVASPTSTHYDVTVAALEHGKDVLCEKPMTTSAVECQQLIALAEEHMRVLMVGHVFVFNPAVQKLGQYVVKGALGELYYMSARRTNLGPVRSDVDAVWDLASHDLSIFDHLLGGALPLAVSACGGAFLSNQRADVAFITASYPGNVVGHIHVSWLDPQKRREVTVVGSEKMAQFNDVSMDAPLWLHDKGVSLEPRSYESFEQFRIHSWERDAVVPKVSTVEPLQIQAGHFLDCVTSRKAPQTDGESAFRVIRALEAVSRSLDQHGAPVEVQAAGGAT